MNIVECKECLYLGMEQATNNISDDPVDIYYCKHRFNRGEYQMVKPNDYCSYGRVRVDGNDKLALEQVKKHCIQEKEKYSKSFGESEYEANVRIYAGIELALNSVIKLIDMMLEQEGDAND